MQHHGARTSTLQIYVGVVPRSVKSPLVILTHHVISALYLLIPYHYPQVWDLCVMLGK